MAIGDLTFTGVTGTAGLTGSVVNVGSGDVSVSLPTTTSSGTSVYLRYSDNLTMPAGTVTVSGTSGWTMNTWDDGWYPVSLVEERELETPEEETVIEYVDRWETLDLE